MSSSRLGSTSAQSSTHPAPRKFAWDWADDDHDDTWLDDTLNDSSIFSPLSPFTTTSSSIASTVSNSLALTFSEPHLSSPLSQQPNTTPDKAVEFTTQTLQSPEREEATDARPTFPNPTPPPKLTPKSAWRPIPKANPIDIRVGDTMLYDATTAELVPPNQPRSAQPSAFNSPVVLVAELNARNGGPKKLRAYHDRTLQGGLALSPEAIKSAEKKKSQLCLAYVSGSCPRGDNCVYMHYDVEVAPAEIVEALSSGDTHEGHNSGPLNGFSTVSSGDDPVMQLPFRNPFSLPYLHAPTPAIMPTSPVPHNLFINQAPRPSLPSLQPDGWWDNAVSMSPTPSNHGSSNDPHPVANSSPTAPSTASSYNFQLPPRLHLVESNFTSKGNARPPPGLTCSPRSAISDTIVTQAVGVLCTSTESNPAHVKHEVPSSRRWSTDGSMRGSGLGQCKHPQLSSWRLVCDQRPLSHSPPRARSLTNALDIEDPEPPPGLSPTTRTLAVVVSPRPFAPLPDKSARVPPLPNPTGLTIYPTARVLSGGVRFSDMVSLTSKKGRRAVRAQAEIPKGIKVRDVNAGVIMVDAEMEVAIENARQRAVAQQAQEPARTKPGAQRRCSQPNPTPRRGSSRASVASRRSSVASTAFTASSGTDVICGMYKATGMCRFGPSCKFRHDIEPLNLPGARDSFEMFGTKKPIAGSQSARLSGSRRRASMPQTPSSSSSRSISGLTDASLQTPSPDHVHRSGPPLPSQSSTYFPIGAPHPLRFPMLGYTPHCENMASDPTRPELRVNFPTQQARQPSLDRIDVVAYPDTEYSTLIDAEHEDVVNVAILQSIMRAPTPLSKPRDKLEHKTLSGLILAETAEPSLDL